MDTSKDDGLIQVLAERLANQRLPRALSIKERVEKGETLSDFDITFLEEVFDDAHKILPIVDRHPEWQSLTAKVMSLYDEITNQALKNEQAKKSR